MFVMKRTLIQEYLTTEYIKISMKSTKKKISFPLPLFKTKSGLNVSKTLNIMLHVTSYIYYISIINKNHLNFSLSSKRIRSHSREHPILRGCWLPSICWNRVQRMESRYMRRNALEEIDWEESANRLTLEGFGRKERMDTVSVQTKTRSTTSPAHLLQGLVPKNYECEFFFRFIGYSYESLLAIFV